MQQSFQKSFSLILLIIFVSLSCSAPTEEKEIEGNTTNFCIPEAFKDKINLYEVQKVDIVDKLHLTGSVETDPDRVLNFISLVSGIITNTYFTIGDEVKKGQVLADLKSTDLTSLQSEQKTLSSQLRVATKRLESARSMYESGISSEKDLMEAQSEYDVLNTGLERVENNLSLFSPSPQQGIFHVKAPASGIITDKKIAAGTQITSEGIPLFTISNLKEVWIMANVYASNVEHVHKGMEAEVRAYSYEDLVFKGTVSVISQVLDSESKVLKARIVLDNEDLKLKPGMLVDVYVTLAATGEAIAVPTDYLVFDSNTNFAITYRNECSIEIRPVTIMSKDAGVSYIQDGLSAGETIITKNNLLIYEQLKNFQN